MTEPITVAVVTPIPSPYQVELFDRIAAERLCRPLVIYLWRGDSSRLWSVPACSHEHLFWEDGTSATMKAEKWIHSSDLTVFSWYADGAARRLMMSRVKTGRPWCYWGERPGYQGLGLLGRLRRRWYLAALRHSSAAIWGIGSWSIEAWQREFGKGRKYFNVPYFSDLSRFIPPIGKQRQFGCRRFLFSGALISRKGVDLLAEAFTHLVIQRPLVRLDFVGAGELESALRARLRSVGDRVRFLGFRDWPDLPAYYHESDILCAPSRYDGWGLIVPEGLAAGLPVIATDRMGAAIDLIEPGRNGWRIPAGSLSHLEQVMREAADLTDPQLDAMSLIARSGVERHSLGVGARTFCDAARTTLAYR